MFVKPYRQVTGSPFVNVVLGKLKASLKLYTALLSVYMDTTSFVFRASHGNGAHSIDAIASMAEMELCIILRSLLKDRAPQAWRVSSIEGAAWYLLH